MYNDSVYSVIADYEKYAEAQQEKGEKAVSNFKYILGHFKDLPKTWISRIRR